MIPTRRATRSLRRLLAATVLFAAGAHAATSPYTARYELTRNGTQIGELVQQLTELDDGTLQFDSTTVPRGLLATLLSATIEERSTLERHKDRLRPLRYHHRRRGVGAERRIDIVFEWPKMRVRNVIDGDPWTMTVPAGTFDKHAVLLAVIEDLAGGTLQDDYAIADGGMLKRYRFVLDGRETVDTPAGRFETVIVRRRRDARTHGTDFWHAPQLGHLPVRIERTSGDGDLYRLLLTDISSPPER